MASMERKGSPVLEFVKASARLAGSLAGEESSPLQGDPALLFGPRRTRARSHFARTCSRVERSSGLVPRAINAFFSLSL